jgi:hypothetical protein
MHDPLTLAFQIKRPWPHRATVGGQRYWPPLVSIWHVDPERDGSDDSCGWFMRARHGDPQALARIRAEFAFHWDADWGWFQASDGAPRYSVFGVTLDMFYVAARRALLGRLDPHGWRRGRDFVCRHQFDILHFAENTIDSLFPAITQQYGSETREERIDYFAAVVYGCILRWNRPWYRHPRWHVHHWRVQVHPVEAFKRWAFSRCARCGKRFPWGYAPTSYGWGGHGPQWFKGEPGVYHHDCRHPDSPGVASAKPA